MITQIKAKIKEWQDKGVPLFYLRDPITKIPSVSLTLLVVSFTLSILSLLNKFVKLVDGVDIDNTLQLLIISSSLYFGRKITNKTGKSTTEVDKE